MYVKRAQKLMFFIPKLVKNSCSYKLFSSSNEDPEIKNLQEEILHLGVQEKNEKDEKKVWS